MKETPGARIPYPEPSDGTQTWSYWAAQAQRVDRMLAPYARLRRDSNTSSGSNIVFETAIFDPFGLWQGDEKVTIPTGGVYRIIIAGTYYPSGNADGRYRFQRPDTGAGPITFELWTGGETDFCFTTEIMLTEGETVFLDYGSNHNIPTRGVEFTIEKVF